MQLNMFSESRRLEKISKLGDSLEQLKEIIDFSINGNISTDDNDGIFEHTHAMFSYLENGEVKF